MKRVAILGSTGSIGQSALAVVAAHPERLRVVALAAGENVSRFVEQVVQFAPDTIAMASHTSLAGVQAGLRAHPRHAPIATAACEAEGLIAAATHPEADVVLFASSGTAALDAVLAAIDCGKTIALANKEILVMAGSIVMERAARRGVAVLPVDSEHNAIHQCVHAREPDEIRRFILTASGGPFRELPAARLHDVTPEDALRHPTWRMGPKITIDSATLMNKGLEVIEAHWLFATKPKQIEVVVHPQSIVHSMIELVDGSIIAQLGVTDMRLPIQYAFSYPEALVGAAPATGSDPCRPPGVRGPGFDAVSLPRPGVSGARGRRRAAHRAQRGKRGRSGRVSAASPRVYIDSRRHRAVDGGLRTQRPSPDFRAGRCQGRRSVGAGVRPSPNSRRSERSRRSRPDWPVR